MRKANDRFSLSTIFCTALLMLSATAALGGQPKEKVCHRKHGGFQLLSVAAPSVPAHLAHGDHLILTFWADLDADGFGAGPASQGCVVPPGFVENDDDCDDGASSCTTACSDDDGDSRFDCSDRCSDADGDGYGVDTSGIIVGGGPFTVGQCTTDGVTPCDLGPACLGEDCDDADPAVNPAATEVCNGVDDNCSGAIDEGLTFDDDGDGFTTPDSCEGSKDDCDDGDAAVNPGATEVCNGIDDDCVGGIDDGGVCVADLRVFVSSGLYNGNFGAGQRVLGYLNADAQCQTLADNAALGGSWKAWLSGRPDGAGCGSLQPNCAGHGAADRFVQSPGPYVLVNGTKVADNWADLTDGSLDHAIDRTEVNLVVADEDRVWTNTTTGGEGWDVSTNCALGPPTDGNQALFTWSCGAPSWTAGDCTFQSGKYGDATSTTGSWTGTASSNIGCATQLRLYCFEQ